MKISQTHLVVIPSYNSGPKLAATIREALAHWTPVWLVIDGSTDGSDSGLSEMMAEKELVILRLPHNSGKGSAVLAALVKAEVAGFTHALVMDADGQHPADKIPLFMGISARNPEAMILGVPEFGAEAPASRRQGRRAGNWWANLETFWGGVRDSLFGFRVYPIKETVRILRDRSSGRRYDFDTVTVVRLFWAGIRPINVRVPVRYFSATEGGVSHFRYWRDNLLLIMRHTCLVLEVPFRLPAIWRNRTRALKSGIDVPRVEQTRPTVSP